MVKRLKKRWKIVLGIGLVLVTLDLTLYLNRAALISYVGMKLVDAQEKEVDPDKFTTADFPEIVNVTQNYVDAFKLFLKAKSGDNQVPSYADAVTAFNKIATVTKNPEIQLRSLYMVTLGNFLQLKIDEAYQSGLKVLELSVKLYPKDSRVAKLAKIVSSINKKEITNANELKTAIGEEETGGLADDLNSVVEDDKGIKKMQANLKSKQSGTK